MVCIDIRPTSNVTAPRKYQIHGEQVWVYIALGQSKDAYMYTYLAMYPICTGTTLILYGVSPRKDRIHNAGMGLLYTGMVNVRLHGCRLTSLYDLHWYQDLFKWYLLLKRPDLQRSGIIIYAIAILKMHLRVCRLISLYDLHCYHADVILYPPSKEPDTQRTGMRIQAAIGLNIRRYTYTDKTIYMFAIKSYRLYVILLLENTESRGSR